MRRPKWSRVSRLCRQIYGRRRAGLFRLSRSHEADAENAVRAGSRWSTPSRSFFKDGGHQVRIGIATGLVVVGGCRRRRSAGTQCGRRTPNLAARLQSHAAPNTAVIDATTRRLAGDLFEYDVIRAAALQGF